MSRIIKKKYCSIAIEQPIILHENEIIDIKELKKEIGIMNNIDKKENVGIYVYKEGYNYPESNAYKNIHIWSKAENVLKYIEKWEAKYNERYIKIYMSDNGWGFEKI